MLLHRQNMPFQDQQVKGLLAAPWYLHNGKAAMFVSCQCHAVWTLGWLHPHCL